MNRHRTDIQARFGDTDALGHINNASLAQYAELGRLDFLHGVLGRSVGSIILASLYLDFRRQVAFRERIHVETWIERIGTSSVTLGQVIYADDQRATDVKSVVVYFDYETNTSKAVPAELRELLAAYQQRYEAR
jgi:acyl-CoA thioester hydrolase